MFPRLHTVVTASTYHVEKRFLVESVKLEIDREKCKNCGTCASACPNGVITRGSPDPVPPSNITHRITPTVVLDAANCSYCGTCAYLCPFDALTLYVDGEPVTREHLQLAAHHALPRIVEEPVVLKDGTTGRKFMEGFLKYDKEKCKEGCNYCTVACPTGTIIRYVMLKSRFVPGVPHGIRHRWEPEQLEIHRERCIQCGACAFTCPVSAIEIHRTGIKSDGEFLDPFWPDVVKRLLAYHTTQSEGNPTI